MRTFPKSGRWLVAAAWLALAAGAWASPRKAGAAVFRGKVVRFDAAAITVRSLKSPLIVQTFTYSAAARAKVERLLETSGYQYGDRVTIHYQPGSSVALAISGTPSLRIRERGKRK